MTSRWQIDGIRVCGREIVFRRELFAQQPFCDDEKRPCSLFEHLVTFIARRISDKPGTPHGIYTKNNLNEQRPKMIYPCFFPLALAV